jgi:hypothetical protein
MQKTHSLKYQHCLCSCFLLRVYSVHPEKGEKAGTVKGGALTVFAEMVKHQKIC